jgi:hypothetical protein
LGLGCLLHPNAADIVFTPKISHLKKKVAVHLNNDGEEVNIHRPHLGTEAPYSAFGCLLYMITNIM